MYLLPGIIAFIFFILFDLNKIYFKIEFFNLFFIIGAIFLVFSTSFSIYKSISFFGTFTVIKILLVICAVLSLVALIYALFFALPFKTTYSKSDDLPLVCKGIYAACRHPGFWPFALFYFFLTLLFSGKSLLWCFIIYTACNFIYIVIQDKFIFPKYINGYSQYKKIVPFLIPNKNSILKALKH